MFPSDGCTLIEPGGDGAEEEGRWKERLVVLLCTCLLLSCLPASWLGDLKLWILCRRSVQKYSTAHSPCAILCDTMDLLIGDPCHPLYSTCLAPHPTHAERPEAVQGEGEAQAGDHREAGGGAAGTGQCAGWVAEGAAGPERGGGEPAGRGVLRDGWRECKHQTCSWLVMACASCCMWVGDG